MDDEMIREEVAELERTRKMIEPQLSSIQATFTAVQQWSGMLPEFARAAQMAAEIAHIHNRVVEGMALEREFLPKLASHGWLISPLADWDEPERLHTLYQTGGIDAVEKDLVERIDTEDCRAIVEDVKSRRPYWGRWAATLDKALDALERGDHELAIPIWLAALEGACAEELGIRKLYTDIPAKRKRQRVTAKLMESMSIAHEPMLGAWLDVLVGFSVESRDGGPVLLNRHAVMHGQRPEIGSRKDALQCLLALQVLGYLLDVRDGAEVRTVPTDEPGP